jgi:hypothetical protein
VVLEAFDFVPDLLNAVLSLGNDGRKLFLQIIWFERVSWTL